MRQNGVLSYLHGDHLLSTALTSNGSGTNTGSHYYTAYGRYRGGSELATENRFTNQKLDATGLYYYNARYYDPHLGTFISPDTLVPDPGNLLDYNRYLYARGNPLKYNDPDGHCASLALSGGGTAPVDLLCWEIIASTGGLAPAVGAAVGTAATVAGATMGIMWGIQDGGPAYPPIQPERLPDTGFTVTVPVPGSTTVTSGVPLVPGIDTSTPGTAPVSLPSPSLLEPLSVPGTVGSNIVEANPHGKLGSPGHQAEVANIQQGIKARGNTARGEFRVPTPGGSKNSRYVDVVELDANLQPIVYYQVGVANKNGTMVAREAKAADDIFNATGGPVVFRPYKWK